MKFFDDQPKKGLRPDNMLEKAELCFDATFHIPETIEIVGYSAFSYQDHLRGISIPQSVRQIDQFAFSHSGLKTVFIPSSHYF